MRLRALTRGDSPNRTIATAAEVSSRPPLLPLSALSARLRAIHDALPTSGSYGTFRKRSVSMSDLRAIGRVTGDEYSVFTRGSQRFIVRGEGRSVDVPDQVYNDLLGGKYGRWSGHTHPPGYQVQAAGVDRPFLMDMNQRVSAVWGDDGFHVFGQIGPADDAAIVSEIARRRMLRFYGGQ